MESKKLTTLLLSLGVIASFSGCAYQPSNILDSAQVSAVTAPVEPESKNYEMVVHNGVVIYRDRSSSQTPRGYRETNVSPNSQGVSFGPGNPAFSPKSINIKDKNQ